MKIIIGSTHRPRRGQALVEFALVLTIAVIVLFVSVQLALIGQLYLALGQMNYRGVRYAAISPTCIDGKTPCGMSNQSITQYMLSVASPTIVSITNRNANALAVNYSNVSNPFKPRVQGNTVQITCTLDISSDIFLPNIGLPFPKSLSHTEEAFTE
jgi:Flp pilus assembly protein TadG